MSGQFVFDPDKYDLFGETDYSAEGYPEPARHVAPLYRIQLRHFYLHKDRNPDGSWSSISGEVVLAGSRHSCWPVMMGSTKAGEIRSDGYYWREDGVRFKLYEVSS
ncbi:hypothetical protein FEA48_21095 [Pseudomonas nitroreducens]|uniref:Uncharacterized protein n=1 Tax=Pseudomonas nitroreducens TaxID=46680 RepID=A0A5R8ZZG6_PSENT|nr:hypothetical protein [Pseudomonas nitroreducens]TLP71324.1 hypothetical protein FEA48_21095 [Pseudomonas nitroreducens]